MNARSHFDLTPRSGARTAHALAAALSWPVVLLLLTAPLARAGALSLQFTGADGAPLVDAVALLERVGAKVAVKPMADAEISQSKRQFHPRVTLVTTGTRVTFPNFDTVRHQVYSFSPIKTFELKLYAGVPAVPVVFDKPGFAVFGCNIHDSMAAWIVVADTPWSARSGSNGQARIEAVPPGSYRLRLWHPGLPVNAEAPPVSLTMGAADLEQIVRLSARNEP